MKLLRIVCLTCISLALLLACDIHYHYVYSEDGDAGEEGETTEEEQDDTDVKEEESDVDVIWIVRPCADTVVEDDLHIEWIADTDIESVRIDLVRDDELLANIVESTTSDGEYVWPVPNDINESSEVHDRYQVLLTAIADGKCPDDETVPVFSEYFVIAEPEDNGGLSDISVDSLAITVVLIDNGSLIDSDTITLSLNGDVVLFEHVLVGPPGTEFELELTEGENTLHIIAINEGTTPPNTASIIISNVIEGEALQEWRLEQDQIGHIVISAPTGT